MKKQIVIRCPKCGKIFRHKITSEMKLQQSQSNGGLVPTLITFYKCDHIFIVYLDHYYMSRGFVHVEDKKDIKQLMKIENPTGFPSKVFDLWGKCLLVC
ncbi:MAG: hypothetical protein ACTSVZ_10845 [Promethearchaeota archaeon]